MPDMSGVAKEVFKVLLRYNYSVKLYDDKGMDIVEPSEARRMFAQSPNLYVSLIDDDDNSHLKLVFGKSTHANDIDGLMQALRTTVTKYNMTFQPSQSGEEIDPKNFRNLETVSESLKEMIMRLCEGLYGTSRSSYLQLDNAKMVIHHQGRIDTRRRDGRAERIAAIFVENAVGKRVQMAAPNLVAGRALVEHINGGGKFTDSTSKRLLESPLLDTFKARLDHASDDTVRLEIRKLEAQFADIKDPTDIFFHRQLMETAKKALSSRRVGASTLAENNEVVRDFLAWTENFAPDTALLKESEECGCDESLEAVNDCTITREDILLPNKDEPANLGREVSKAVVHDDPSNPDEESLPDTGHVDRLRTLAGLRRGQSY